MEIVCAICCVNYEPNDSIISVHCGHVFHENCLTIWSNKSPTCPMCEATFEVNHATSVHQKIYLDFDRKDCNQCQQYSLLMEIKENQIEKLNTQHKDFNKKMKAKELEIRELKAENAQNTEVITKKNNELTNIERTVALLKKELNELRITKDNEKDEQNNNKNQ